MQVVMPNYTVVMMPVKFLHFFSRRKPFGKLREDYSIQTTIIGHSIVCLSGPLQFKLTPDGTLTVFAGSIWDFGTMAVDTPAMVFASLPHDCFCIATDKGLLPWECRMQADTFFWECLSAAGATVSRLWRTPAVMLNSQLLARWSKEDYVA